MSLALYREARPFSVDAIDTTFLDGRMPRVIDAHPDRHARPLYAGSYGNLIADPTDLPLNIAYERACLDLEDADRTSPLPKPRRRRRPQALRLADRYRARADHFRQRANTEPGRHDDWIRAADWNERAAADVLRVGSVGR